MKTYIAISERGEYTTELQFDAVSEPHAEEICKRHGWTLFGELIFEIPSDGVLEAMIESHGHTLQ